MTNPINMDNIHDYFADKLKTYGATPRGVDWNSEASQENRFMQLCKVIEKNEGYSLIDYGAGFGSLYDYLYRGGHRLQYFGYDIVAEMVRSGNAKHPGDQNCKFTTSLSELKPADYVIASGIFNIKLHISNESWTDYVVENLGRMNALCTKGFSFNLLTKYSDPEHMRADLYYADPCYFFDHCKRYYSRNVALLHDYNLYDFTIIVRKL
jgi:hypothetical protein